MTEDDFIEICHRMLNPPKPPPLTEVEQAAHARQAHKQMEESVDIVYYFAVEKNSPDQFAQKMRAIEFVRSMRSCGHWCVIPIEVD